MSTNINMSTKKSPKDTYIYENNHVGIFIFGKQCTASKYLTVVSSSSPTAVAKPYHVLRRD